MENVRAVSKKGKYQNLYNYRNTICSADGPEKPTTRHVLLTLSQFMDENMYCFPSIKTLAEDTALNERTVRNRLFDAVEDGWIERNRRGTNGQGWRLYSYVGITPKRAELNAAPSVDNSGFGIEQPDPSSKGAESSSQRAVTECKNVRKEDPTNRSVNNSNNRSVNNDFLKKHLQDKKEEVEIDPKFNHLIKLLVIRKMVNNKETAKHTIASWIESKGEEKVYEAYMENKDINENFFEQFYESLKCNG